MSVDYIKNSIAHLTDNLVRVRGDSHIALDDVLALLIPLASPTTQSPFPISIDEGLRHMKTALCTMAESGNFGTVVEGTRYVHLYAVRPWLLARSRTQPHPARELHAQAGLGTVRSEHRAELA